MGILSSVPTGGFPELSPHDFLPGDIIINRINKPAITQHALMCINTPERSKDGRTIVMCAECFSNTGCNYTRRYTDGDEHEDFDVIVVRCASRQYADIASFIISSWIDGDKTLKYARLTKMARLVAGGKCEQSSYYGTGAESYSSFTRPKEETGEDKEFFCSKIIIAAFQAAFQAPSDVEKTVSGDKIVMNCLPMNASYCYPYNIIQNALKHPECWNVFVARGFSNAKKTSFMKTPLEILTESSFAAAEAITKS